MKRFQPELFECDIVPRSRVNKLHISWDFNLNDLLITEEIEKNPISKYPKGLVSICGSVTNEIHYPVFT